MAHHYARRVNVRSKSDLAAVAGTSDMHLRTSVERAEHAARRSLLEDIHSMEGADVA